MKRPFVYYLAYCLLGILTAGGTASAQTFSLPPQIYARPGDIVYVDVKADLLIRGVTAIHLILDYQGRSPSSAPQLTAAIKNPNNAVEVLIGTLVPSPLMGLDVRTGEISIAFVSFSPNKAGYGPGLVTSLPLQVPANAPTGARYGLILLKHEAIGTNDKEFYTQATPGILTVDPNPPIFGDVTGDGRINILDAVACLKIVTKIVEPTDKQIYSADVDPRDGRVTVTDVIGILRKIVGLPPRPGSLLSADSSGSPQGADSSGSLLSADAVGSTGDATARSSAYASSSPYARSAAVFQSADLDAYVRSLDGDAGAQSPVSAAFVWNPAPDAGGQGPRGSTPDGGGR